MLRALSLAELSFVREWLRDTASAQVPSARCSGRARADLQDHGPPEHYGRGWRSSSERVGQWAVCPLFFIYSVMTFMLFVL